MCRWQRRWYDAPATSWSIAEVTVQGFQYSRAPEQPEGSQNEFPDDEIELKLQFATVPEPTVLQDVVSTLERAMPITTLPSRAIAGRVLHYDYYAAIHDGLVEPAFVLWYHPPAPWRIIRRRGSPRRYVVPSQKFSVSVSCRTEQWQVAPLGVSEDEIAELIGSASEWYGGEVVPLPTLRRTLHRALIRTTTSGRFYSVCLDFSEFRGRLLSQLEIEYMWGSPGLTPGFGQLDDLVSEYAVIADNLLSSDVGRLLSPTAPSKFEWMIAIQTEASGSPGTPGAGLSATSSE